MKPLFGINSVVNINGEPWRVVKYTTTYDGNERKVNVKFRNDDGAETDIPTTTLETHMS